MNEPLENVYFNWLCAKVVDKETFPVTDHYWKLLRKLHTTEFVWMMSGDDNRAEDGKELRRDFILAADMPDNPEWRTVVGCSVLEMFIAFAKRAEFQTDMPMRDWFWEFIDNLGLDQYDDRSRFDEKTVETILDQFIWRTYHPNGIGGLFPLDYPREDQREVEVFYQFCNYLVDQHREI
jgi:hypothetical protein